MSIKPKFPAQVFITLNQRASWEEFSTFLRQIENSPLVYNYSCGHRGTVCGFQEAQDEIAIIKANR